MSSELFSDRSGTSYLAAAWGMAQGFEMGPRSPLLDDQPFRYRQHMLDSLPLATTVSDFRQADLGFAWLMLYKFEYFAQAACSTFLLGNIIDVNLPIMKLLSLCSCPGNPTFLNRRRPHLGLMVLALQQLHQRYDGNPQLLQFR